MSKLAAEGKQLTGFIRTHGKMLPDTIGHNVIAELKGTEFPDEFITVETMTLSHALGLIEKGAITDGKTALTILYAAGFRAGR
jgi:hypothetical protein